MQNFNGLQMNGPAGLRSIASQEYGVKNVKSYSKQSLIDTLEAIEADRAEQAIAKDMADSLIVKMDAKAATETKAAKKAEKATRKALRGGKCTAPNCTRKQDASVIGPELCTQHLTEADWENVHNDDDHENGGSDEATAWKAQNCWICHPELNKSGMKITTGTSRLGMTMSVPVRAAGEVKAATTLARLEAKGIKAMVAIPKKSGTVVLTATLPLGGSMTLTWALTGAYSYEESSLKTARSETKLRNVKAALKALGIVL